MNNSINKHKKTIKVLAVVVLALIVLTSAFFIIWNSLHSAVVNVTVAPTIAKVYIGDRAYGSVGTYNIIPGEYDVRVEADGFISKTGRLVAVSGETVEVSLYLEPTEDNIGWYDNHPQDALIVGEIKSSYMVEDVQKLTEENPILKRLPIEIDYYTKNYSKRVKYTISYVLIDNNSNFKITITDETGGNYDDALAKLKARGVDLDKYEIEYRDISDEYSNGHAGI